MARKVLQTGTRLILPLSWGTSSVSNPRTQLDPVLKEILLRFLLILAFIRLVNSKHLRKLRD